MLPPADAVVNPKQETCAYPYKQLCGAGVAFQLMRALYRAEGREDKELEPLLCFLAIATVCDVVDLTEENRIFVREGLNRIGLTQNTGLRALLRVHGCGRDNCQFLSFRFCHRPVHQRQRKAGIGGKGFKTVPGKGCGRRGKRRLRNWTERQ